MELALIMGIADEAAKWMLEQGIKQWESPPPSECWALFREEIVAERVYFIMREGSDEVVGFFRLKWSGEPLWEDESNAGYLYSLAIRPRYIGQGIGPAVIKWLMQHFASLGKDRFRVDCIASNDRLRRWYEELGFKVSRRSYRRPISISVVPT